MKKAGVFILVNVLWLITVAGAWAYDYEPASAYDPVNDRYLVVYDRFVSADETSFVACQLVDNQGTAIGDPVDLNSTEIYTSPYPSVVYDAAAGQFLVVWQQDVNAIYGRFVGADGTPTTEPTAISNTSGYTETNPVAAYDPVNGQSLVVWQSFDVVTFVTVGALVRFDSGTTALVRDPIQTLAVGDGINYLSPCITFDTTNNRYLVAWNRQDYSTSENVGLGAAFVSANLAVSELPGVTAGNESMYPSVAYDSANNNFLLVWVDTANSADYNILGNTIQSDGNMGDPITISAASGTQLFPAVAFDPEYNGGGFLVTWEDLRSATDYDIYGQWVTGGMPNGAAFVVAGGTGDQQSAAMAYNTTCANMLTSHSSSAAGENVIDHAITGPPCPSPTGHDYPAAAFDPVNDQYLVVYEQYIQATGNYLVTCQRLNSDGTAIDTPFYIHSEEAAYHPTPTVVYHTTEGRFLVVWRQSYNEIYGRFVADDGSFSTPATLISDSSDYEESQPAAAYNQARGRSLVVWKTSDGLNTYIAGKQVMLYNNNELLLDDTSNLVMGSETGYDLASPCIAVDTANNRYLVAWSRYIESTSYGIGASLRDQYGSNYLSISNDAVSGSYEDPAVAYDSDNDNYLLVWRDRTNVDDPNLVGTIVPSDGTLSDPVDLIDISTETTGQADPAIAFAPSRGGFMVAWVDGYQIYFNIHGQWVTDGVLEGEAFIIGSDATYQDSPALAYNTATGDMLTVYVSSVTGYPEEYGLKISFAAGSGTTNAQAIIPAGTTVADYRMITFPITAQPDLRYQLAEQLGEPDPTQWRMLRWNPDTGEYMEITDENWPEYHPCIPGRAYWFISRPGTTLTVYGTPGSGTDSAEVILRPGWNQIGSPFDFSVQWNSDITVSDGVSEEPVGESTLISNTLWQYDDEGGYIQASLLVQGRGYWVQNTTSGDLTMTILANRYTGGIWNDLRQMVAHWMDKFPRSAVAAESTPPPPPGALEPDPESDPGGCFIAAAAFFNAD